MPKPPVAEPFEVERGDTTLAGEMLGDGPDVVLMHGLTATRRYTVMGSKALARSGYRLTTFDARGHGESEAAERRGAYRYSDMDADLEAVLDRLGAERAVVGGASMGAHTALAFALRCPERVSALVLITPAFSGEIGPLEQWDALADGLERGGVDGFLAAYEPGADARWRDTVLTVTRQRLERHRHPHAVADALRAVPRSRPFDGLDALARVTAPALVVASRDEADPGHPLAVGRAYAERLPRARLVVEEAGRSPLAWQGGSLSRAIADFLAAQS